MRKRRRRFLLAALALFLAACQPLTAFAAEEVEARGSVTVQVSQEVTPTRFLTRLSRHTDAGAPLRGTTRAQYVQLLYEAAGAPTVDAQAIYLDVSADSGCAAAVTWAHQSGILDGGEDGGWFRPEDCITVAEASDLLARALSAVGDSARQVANGILAAYTGRAKEEDWALTPAELLHALDDMLMGTAAVVEFPAAVSGGTPPEPHTGPSPIPHL